MFFDKETPQGQGGYNSGEETVLESYHSDLCSETVTLQCTALTSIVS